ncbi:MAG TPA: tRNA (adenosine(37)-N6)-dimethylallyltransferase MiaA [Planctomycetota bacterium]|nr:tRNA (adenosine(37)-N6)-dimethylallyltransferase MiaA [Planctomycetota bacterium]
MHFAILTGPTASGKSAVAQLIAEKNRAEILSIDSMKLYRGLDIGTGKPTLEERARIPHLCIDTKDPWESASVAEFVSAAEALVANRAACGTPLIGEGGTALYLKALSEGLFEGPGRNASLRARLETEIASLGSAELHARLKAVDPKAASKILPSDARRIVRALEVFELTGVPIGAWQQQWGRPRTDLDVRIACLNLPRPILYARIDARVRAMLAAGWVDECRRLLALEKPLSREAAQALGYKTLFAHLRGELTLNAAIDRICFDTHHFARRQLHWFKRLPKTRFIELSGSEAPAEIAPRVEQAWEHAE